MKPQCIEAVSKAAGRDLNKQETQDIEDRINRAYRRLAQDDQSGFQNMSQRERLDAAAKQAAEDLKSEMLKSKQRVIQTVEANDRIENYLNGEKARGIPMMEALERKLRKFNDGKSMTSDVWYQGQARGNIYLARMLKTLEETSPTSFGLFSNKEGLKAFTYELFHLIDPNHPDSSSFLKDPNAIKSAQEAAREWSDTAEQIRQDFNSRGGEIGKLEDWRMPQAHNEALVFGKGKPADRERWINDILPKLDETKYVNPDGSRMTGDQMMKFLKESWTTITTGGANKAADRQGAGMPSALSRRHAEERVLHFKDADGYLDYMDKYSRTDLFSNMVNHVQRLGRDITLLDTFGPNPDTMFEHWKNKAIEDTANSGDQKLVGKAQIDAAKASMSNLYDYVSGKSRPIANKYIAQFFDTWRNMLGSAMLGSAPLTALKDFANAGLTAAYNGMSQARMLREMVKNHNPIGFSDRMRTYQRAGLALDVYSSEINRWGNDALGALWSKKMNNLTHRISGMVATDAAKRAATGTLLYSTIGEAADKHATLGDVPEAMQRVLTSKGVTDRDFQVWKLAEKENWGSGNDTVLTPESIYRIPDDKLTSMVGIEKGQIPDLQDAGQLKRTADQIRDEAAVKLLAHALSEMDMVVPYTGAEHGKYTQGLQRGSVRDELFRSLFLFKGFALADMERHFLRGWNLPDGIGRAAYIGGFVALSTLMGAVGTQLYELINGRDPLDMTDHKFWGRAMLKGGGLGIYGDFLFGDQTQNYGGGFQATLMGPQFGSAEQLYNMTIGAGRKEAAYQAGEGKEPNEAANAFRFFKSMMPLQNLWYTRAVTDRLIFNQLQEMVAPGSMARAEQKARKEFHQEYWWPNLSPTPDRAPDIDRATGQ